LKDAPGDGMSCLLYAVLRGYGDEYDHTKEENKTKVDKIVEKVREKMKESRKQENSHQWRTADGFAKHLGENEDSNQGRGESGSMLDLVNTDGQVAIAILREDNKLDRDRGIVIRVQESGSPQWIWEAISSDNGKEPIYLHLSGQHFQTLIKKEELSENQ
jgi:hypothetical protein